MLQNYHRQICQRALGAFFSARALECLIAANLGQDRLRYQFGHPEFHFDDNAFEAGYAYIDMQRQIVFKKLNSNEGAKPAWQAFGRLTHAVQDFYAHSNYIQLWRAVFSEGELPEPTKVQSLVPELLNHPQLRSGKVYLWDWLAFVPGLYSLSFRLVPEDSHTHMNLDSPKRGELFPYAFEAAIHRTLHEYQLLAQNLDPITLACFTDRS